MRKPRDGRSKDELIRVPCLDRPWYRYAHKLLYAVEPGEDGRALDVGCGAGEFLSILAREGLRAEGVEGNPLQVEELKRAGMPVRVVDLEEGLPLEDSSFIMLVTCLEVIEHIARAEFLLREIHRVLEPSGWLLLSTPNFSFLNNRFHYLFGMLPLNEGVHLRHFNPRRLREVLRQAGFLISATNSYGVLPGVSTVTTRVFRRPAVLWRVPSWVEGLLAYDLIYLARKG